MWSKLLMILITLLVDDLAILSPEVTEANSFASATDCFLLMDDCLDQPDPPVVVAVVEFQPPDFLP